jgi:hypothetical protein
VKLGSLEPFCAVVAAWLLLGTLDAAAARENAPRPVADRHAGPPVASSPAAASPASAAARALPAPSDPDVLPDRDSDPALIRAFLDRHPGHADSARFAALHDQKLRPCPGVRLDSLACAPELPALAEGVLDRAERYLATCLVCKERVGVTSLRARSRLHVERLATEDARQRFEAAFERQDFTRASQILADAAPRVQKPWLARALKRLDRRVPGSGASLDACRLPEGVAMLVSPAAPIAGDRVRVLAVSEDPIPSAELEIQLASGAQAIEVARLGDTDGTHHGPPHYVAGEASLEQVGEGRAMLKVAGATLGCQRFTVSRRRERVSRPDTVWNSSRGWDRAHENLYAAFVALLFLAPENTRWKGFHEVTRDRARNLLHGHLGLAEDDAASPLLMQPDCADAPYYFRAYFAWKLGLPFGRHECRFGTTNGPPRCAHWLTNEGAPSDGGVALGTSAEGGTEAEADAAPRPGRVTEFRDFLARLKDDIHARSLRTELSDTATDLYPLPLTRAALRPGTVFTDPYGHTLTLVRWLPQSEKSDGRLLAVDAQPDGSLRIKRFWRGNFLFPNRHPIGGHGFKAFRPIVLDRGEARPLSNDEIAIARGYGNFSLVQSRLMAADFYGTMSRLINPRPLPPEREYRELHQALHAQLELRVSEVQTAEELVGEGRVIEMPSGRAIFRTTGSWEALSTPCRDLRLLVGMDALLAFPEEAAAALRGSAGEALRRELEQLHDRWARELVVRYRRSDGSSQALTLAELLERRRAFEMAYNPNDCAELRWGASDGSAELSTCQRRAPAEQRRKMQEYRHWFEKRYSCG